MEEKKIADNENTVEAKAQSGAAREELKKLSKEKLIEYIEALVAENDKLIGSVEELKKENESLKSERDVAFKKADDYLGKLAGLKGDFDRFKARNAQVKEAATEEGRAFVIQKIMPILDTFDRAKQSVTDESTMVALELILKQFEKVLGDLGVEEMEVLGTVFDPNTSNAVIKQQVEDEGQKGTIIGVAAKGFKQGDKVLRYPQVIVGV